MIADQQNQLLLSVKLSSLGKMGGGIAHQINTRLTVISLVLVNLICNSIDAIDSLPEKWIRISVVATDSTLRISIKDSGYGIQDDVAKKMFLLFYSSKGIGKGTGLGLSIFYNVIANHQGKLSDSKASGHTEFIIEIPYNVEPMSDAISKKRQQNCY